MSIWAKLTVSVWILWAHVAIGAGIWATWTESPADLAVGRTVFWAFLWAVVMTFVLLGIDGSQKQEKK